MQFEDSRDFAARLDDDVDNHRRAVGLQEVTNAFFQLLTIGDDAFVVADIPGLIEGAHQGAGLGTRFLGHVERCQVLLHLVDGTGEDVAAAYRTVRQELTAYGAGLETKPEVVALNKTDALDPDLLAERSAALETAAGGEVLLTSGVARTGLDDAVARVFAFVRAFREKEAPQQKAFSP